MSISFSKILQEGKFEPSKGRFARTISDVSTNEEGEEDTNYLAEASNILTGRVFKQEIDLAIFDISQGMTQENFNISMGAVDTLKALYFRFEDMAERLRLKKEEQQAQIQSSIGVGEANVLPPDAPLEM